MGKTITVGDVPFVGDFFLIDNGTEQVLFDSRKDGGDVEPLLCIAPVVWMETKTVGTRSKRPMFFIYIKTEWEGE